MKMSQISVLVGIASLWLAVGAAVAERPVTADEKARLAEALVALGCTGGTMQFDDGAFEIDAVKCADGKSYDLKFDAAFKLIAKEPAD
jgi:hypothetical protein